MTTAVIFCGKYYYEHRSLNKNNESKQPKCHMVIKQSETLSFRQKVDSKEEYIRFVIFLRFYKLFDTSTVNVSCGLF